jgi:predicted TIM-barrel fold metal-dependent hydrolase
MADYYRSRKIGCIVFSVDERLTGRPQVPNDDVAAFAAENRDIMFAFASVDPDART